MSKAIGVGEDGDHVTFCRLCEAQCGLLAEVKDGVIIRIKPDRKHPVSRGHLCVKAPGMLRVTYDEDRVLRPLRRKGPPGEFETVTWEEAISDIARRLKGLIDTHGGNALGSYIGNPAAFATMHYGYGFEFIRMLGSDQVYNAQHVDTGARVVASDQVFGDSGRYPFPDLPDTEFLMIFGGNPAVSHMSLICAPRALEALDGVARRGSVVVVDPRRTETARRYEHRPIAPDGDVWLLAGMLRTVIDEKRCDKAYLADRVVGWEELVRSLGSLPWDAIEAGSAIPRSEIEDLARRFASAGVAACYGRVGTNRGRYSTLSNVLMDAMNLATGNFARPGGSVIGRSPFEPEVGKRRPSAYGERYSRVAKMPVIAGVQPGGSLSQEILTAGKGQIRALFVDSGNPVISYPNGGELEQALEALELLVSLDLYVNETNRYADYILPVPSFYERADANDVWAQNAPEPWVQSVEAVIPPRGESRHEYDIYNGILKVLGLDDLGSHMLQERADPERSYMAFADVGLRSGQYGDQFGARPEGLTLDKLHAEHPHGLLVRDRIDAGRSWEQVGYEDRKARLWTPLIESELARLKREQPRHDSRVLKLFGRRFLHGMNSWMHNSEKVIRNVRPTLLMHPDDAEQRQILDGQRVRVENVHGHIEVLVEISRDVVRGSVNYPHGFGHNGGWRKADRMEGANVNLLASSNPADWEQVSGNCHLDGIPVDVKPIVQTGATG